MSSPYPVLHNRPIDKFKVTELKEELKRRKLPTRGLKEELIRRLDEALRQEQDAALSKAESDGDSTPMPVEETAKPVNAENSKDGFEAGDMTDKKVDESIGEVNPADVRVPLDNIGGSGSTPRPEEEITEPVNAEHPKDGFDGGDMTDKKVDENIGEVNAADIRVPLDEEKVSVVGPVDGAIPTIVEKDQIARITDVEISATAEEEHIDEVSVVQTSDLGSVTVESATALSGQDRDKKEQLENHISNSSQVEAKVSSSNLENQVSEVSPVLGFQVTCDSVSSDVSIDEKTELKDNIIADEAKLVVDVKPETVQPILSSVAPDDGESHPMDVEDPHEKKVSIEEPGNENNKNVDIVTIDFTVDSAEKVSTEEPGNEDDKSVDIVKIDANVDSAEKLQLDRSPGDDSMEEDISEGKIADSKLDSEIMIDEKKEVEVNMRKEELGSVASVDDARKTGHKETIVEDSGSNVQSMKRKAYDQGAVVGSNDIVKRQRGWKSEDLKVPENKKGDGLASSTPKDLFQPSFSRSFSRSDSIAKEEPPKERVVPLTSKAPTDSLLIENFLRPFTLKAVKDLLGQKGTVTNFWMDAIKTHCYVSFSSVEEAIETRNAVYNLQWPPNGGKLLVADFVDPQEVKDKVEAPPQPPLTVATPTFAAPPSVQPQPSPRQLMQNKQLQPPVSLPPPPPLPEKVDPPIVTLDDLFRKTKATPRIYYLPLTDEQVAAKLKAQGKSIKQ